MHRRFNLGAASFGGYVIRCHFYPHPFAAVLRANQIAVGVWLFNPDIILTLTFGHPLCSLRSSFNTLNSSFKAIKTLPASTDRFAVFDVLDNCKLERL